MVKRASSWLAWYTQRPKSQNLGRRTGTMSSWAIRLNKTNTATGSLSYWRPKSSFKSKANASTPTTCCRAGSKDYATVMNMVPSKSNKASPGWSHASSSRLLAYPLLTQSSKFALLFPFHFKLAWLLTFSYCSIRNKLGHSFSHLLLCPVDAFQILSLNSKSIAAENHIVKRIEILSVTWYHRNDFWVIIIESFPRPL